MASAAEIADALDRLVAAAARQRAAAAATRRDVNATDLLALDIVRRAGRIAPGQLAREMQLTAGGTNGVIRRIVAAQLITRNVNASDRRDVGLEITRRGETLMTTGVGGWDPQLLEHLSHQDAPSLTNMMSLLTTVAEAAEHRADTFATTARAVSHAAGGVPLPVRWG
ncbi:MarR family transcriptional regulator [Conexibacter woesei]|uniref:MarR family transcriptional regulator n=1 Tax=Conexibacter woesei TaxID=191495 RepID=UPI000404C36E|nr:MarR family transcriptional regulator [Conexibacter woesei]